MASFSVNLLCFGSHLPFARRCLGSVLDRDDWQDVQDIRVGLNAVCEETLAYVQLALKAAPVPAYVFVSEKNAYKYPLMRRMFYEPSLPDLAPNVIWMDDDSCLRPGFRYQACARLLAERESVIGKIYTYRRSRLKPEQKTWLTCQDWYAPKTGLPDPIRFVTGGWWAIRRATLQRWNWPAPEIIHNGGDYTLGLLCAHQGIRLLNAPADWFWVNADETGRPSSAIRRGETTAHVGTPAALRFEGRQHAFDCGILRPNAAPSLPSEFPRIAW